MYYVDYLIKTSRNIENCVSLEADILIAHAITVLTNECQKLLSHTIWVACFNAAL